MKYTLKRYAHIYNLFLILFFCISSEAQNKADLPKQNVRSVTQDSIISPVPNSMVRNIEQDKNGNTLIAASWGGVFRYDRKSFTNITSKIGSHRFWDVLEDRGGKLWFATTDSGVYNYNGKTFDHFTTREGLSDNSVFSIYEDKTGMIWFGTGGGLSRYDGRSFQNFTAKDGLPNGGGRTIIQDKTGKLWIATEDGPCFYDGKTFTVLKNKNGEAFKNVRSITEDKKGNIWLGGSDGLWRYDGSTFTNFTQKFVGCVYEDSKGNIWTTGEVKLNGDWVLYRYDQKSLDDKTPAVTKIISTEKMLCGISEAGDGSIWFGSLFGVYRYDGKTITDFKNKDGQK